MTVCQPLFVDKTANFKQETDIALPEDIKNITFLGYPCFYLLFGVRLAPSEIMKLQLRYNLNTV